METNRLKPMVENYDEPKFNRLFKKTEGLRKKLASEIDARRFGVDRDEILSWFSVKFIYVYNKYCQDQSEEILLGHLIKSMQWFKCRVLRNAYTHKHSQSIVSTSDIEIESSFIENPTEVKPNNYEILFNFIRTKISDNAYTLLELQYNPTPYILARLEELGVQNIHKIPDQVLCDYFDLGFTFKSLRYLDHLKKEIKYGISVAKQHFRSN
jgi:hypothetical protein